MSAYATNRFAGDGVTTAYAINFIGGYIAREHVKAYREDDITKERTAVTILPGQFVGPYQLNGFAPTPVGQTFVLHRSTPAGPLVSFANGSHFTAVSLDIVARQGLFLAAEALDNAGTATGGGGSGGGANEDLEAALAEVRALAAQVDAQVSTVTTAAADAIAAAVAADQSRIAASSSASAASTSAGSASASASNASSSASAASTSAGGAAASATSAVSSMTAAAASATAAGTSATNAGNSATAASTSVTNAGNSATAASGSATAAANSASAAAASATAASAAAASAGGKQEALNAMASAGIAELAAVAAANAGGGGFNPGDFVSTTGNQSVHGVKSFDDPRGPGVQVQDYHALALLRSTVLRGGPGTGGQAVSVGWIGDSGNPGYNVSTDGSAHGRLLTWGATFGFGVETYSLACGGVGLAPGSAQRLGKNNAGTGLEYWDNGAARNAVICTDRTDSIGTLVFAKNTSVSSIQYGVVVAGSVIKPDQGGSLGGSSPQAVTLPGTWKCLGSVAAGGVTLFVRVT